MSKLAKILLLVLLGMKYANVQCGTSDGSLASSFEDLKKLLSTEKTLIDSLENYMRRVEERYSFVTSVVARYRAESEKAKRDPVGYLSIPTNAFALIHRIYRDWPRWRDFSQGPTARVQHQLIEDVFSDLPSEMDFDETIVAITRIKNTYGLRVADLIVGNINGKQYDTRLSALDCYSMGFELFRKEEYYSAAEWLFAALELYKDDPINNALQFSRIKLLAVYAESLRKLHRINEAITLIDIALTIEPTNAGLKRKKRQLEVDSKLLKETPTKAVEEQPDGYTLGCRGEFPYRAFDLYCLYDTETTPFLKFAPFKKELLSINPYIALFYNAITDEEIETLTELSRPQLERSNIINSETRQVEVDSQRFSHIAYLPDDTHNVTLRLNRRISDMSGFDLNGSEPIEIQVYGLGGHYGLHHDFIQDIPGFVGPEGDRLATALFYLTDVEQGGATVFPYKQIAIFPKKGTAALWHNLDKHMNPDYKTLHGACPVLVGIKTSADKSIYGRNQAFRQTCKI